MPHLGDAVVKYTVSGSNEPVYIRVADQLLKSVYGSPSASFKMSLASGSVASASFLANVMYMLTPDVDCFVRVNSSATVDGTSHFIPAYVPEDFYLGMSSGTLYATVTTGTGILYVTSMSSSLL